MKAFISGMMFLTRLPMPNLQVTSNDWKRSVIYYPIIGLIIGSLVALFASLLESVFPLTITSILTIVFWIWITGGLHLDGWMDLADGIGSNRSREESLEIMKDSRVGAMGVIAAICIILVKSIAIYELLKVNNYYVLICSAFFARFILLSAIKYFPYRQEGGLGKGLQTYITNTVFSVNLLLLIFITYGLLQSNGLILFFSTLLGSGLFIFWIYKKFQLLTGDCYGAIVEFCECSTLVLAIAIWGFLG